MCLFFYYNFMKVFLNLFFALLLMCKVFSQDVNELHETARSYIKQGDYTNAAITLEKAIKIEPGNVGITKELAISYMVLKKNNRALEVLIPFIENGKADDQTYQLTGSIYNLLDQRKESDNIYKKGIKKFPTSGALYYEYGTLLLSRQDQNAIKIWEKGIENDPQYAGNYYQACKQFNFSSNRVWTCIYGETFLLLEPGTARTAEIKYILTDTYKKLLSEDDININTKSKSSFEKAYLQIVLKDRPAVNTSFTPELLTMFRTRFLLNWNNTFNKKYPFTLFQIQTNMIEDGLFEAYNQWLFGPVLNLGAYQNWINTHPDEYSAFTNYQTGRIFKFSNTHYYH